MAIINNVNGHEGEAVNFIMECMDKINAEADVADLIQVNIKYLKTFIESFEEREITPVIARAQKIYNAQSNNRPIDIAALKVKNENDVANGIRTVETVEQELPTWPLCFKNPIKITQIFGSIPTGKKKRKGVSVLTKSKLSSKINLLNTTEDVLYLIEYFLKFFFIENEKEYYQEYDQLLDKLRIIGFYPKERKDCFKVKTEDGIANDIICLFLAEDFTVKDNKEFLLNCIDRYYEIFY